MELGWGGWFAVQVVLANVGAFAYLRYIMLTDDRLLDVALQRRKERRRCVGLNTTQHSSEQRSTPSK